MCGITAVISLDPGGATLDDTDHRALEAMTAALHHRGPDDVGFIGDHRVALGNTRLSILDLSDAGHLPAANEEATVWLAYNGEVTNFRELREEFELDRHFPMRSTSDTEVVLRLYELLGIDFVRHLSGMFAMCIYDRRLRRLWFVRDFYGIRPLFWHQTGDRLHVSSEIKAMLELPGFDDRLDEEAFFHYFGLAYMPDRHTPFASVTELQGGWLLDVDLDKGSIEERQYYRVRYEPQADADPDATANALLVEMRDSVRRNLISDAPLGLTLSGGFDTSSILALARDIAPTRDIHTFSIVMEEPSFDEAAYQRIMVDFARTEHHEIRVGPADVADALVEHMAFMDEPSGDGAAIPSFLLAREASQHVKVLLSGEGGDETFNAYETHVASRARHIYRRFAPAPIRGLLRRAAHALPSDYSKLSFDFVAKRFTEGTELDVPRAHYHWRHVLDDGEQRRLLRIAPDATRTDGFFSRAFDRADFDDDLDRISLVDLEYFFIGDLMVKNDRTFMASSVEARFPYMDRLLHEHVARIPASLRMRGLSRRWLQKRAMRGMLPEAIADRSNMGLEMPHSNWFLEGLRPVLETYLEPKRLARYEWLNAAFVGELWRQHLARERDNGRPLWCILNAMVWFDLFVHDRSWRGYMRRPSWGDLASRWRHMPPLLDPS